MSKSKSSVAVSPRKREKSRTRDKSARDDSEPEPRSRRRTPPEFLGGVGTWFSEVIDQMASPRQQRSYQPQASSKKAAKKMKLLPPTPPPTPTTIPDEQLWTSRVSAETKSVGRPGTPRNNRLMSVGTPAPFGTYL